MNIEYKGIVWVGIYVEDFESSVTFYQKILGLRLIGQKGGYAHFDAGNGALLELFSGGKRHTEEKGVDKQSSMAALLVDNLAKTKEILKSRGVQFTANEGSFENQHWATIVDLEGNCIEIKEIS